MIMNGNSVVRPVTEGVFTALVLACAVLCGAAEEDSRWVHPLCQPLAIESNGPLVELADGRLMTIDPQGVRVSQDDGKTCPISPIGPAQVADDCLLDLPRLAGPGLTVQDLAARSDQDGLRQWAG